MVAAGRAVASQAGHTRAGCCHAAPDPQRAPLTAQAHVGPRDLTCHCSLKCPMETNTQSQSSGPCSGGTAGDGTARPDRVGHVHGRPQERGRDLRGAPGPPACTSYLQVGLKSSWVFGLLSFKAIISWSSSRKVSTLLWFRKVPRSVACLGLSGTLYLAPIAPNGSYEEVRAVRPKLDSRGRGSL